MQKKVNLYLSEGVVGDRASLNPTIYTCVNFIAGTDVTTGNFVYASTTVPEQVVATGSASTAPLGFVERVLSNFNYDVKSEGTLKIAKGSEVAVAIKGDFWIKADAAATVGASVYADPSNGKPTLTSTSSTVDTGFKVKKAGAADDMIIISNWALA